MRTQLFMIIAVILSSLLTVSQRAHANEANQLRWLEPTVEQRFEEVLALDQELGSDNNYIAPSSFFFRTHSSSLAASFFYNYIRYTEALNNNLNPRAPPFSLI